MRASLRGSRKLKALQDSKSLAAQSQTQTSAAAAAASERLSSGGGVVGVENEAYVDDEDEKEKVAGICKYLNRQLEASSINNVSSFLFGKR